MTKAINADPYIKVKTKKSQARFKRIKNPKGADTAIGNFLVEVEVTATQAEVYLPISIASGKKITGFMYQIEGTATGAISTASVESRGEGVTQVTVGTILYCKIPAGKTATFRIKLEIKGKVGKMYQVLINQINYKLSPTDARYKRFFGGVSTKKIEFR
jgi:hypothetical protein